MTTDASEPVPPSPAIAQVMDPKLASLGAFELQMNALIQQAVAGVQAATTAANWEAAQAGLAQASYLTNMLYSSRIMFFTNIMGMSTPVTTSDDPSEGFDGDAVEELAKNLNETLHSMEAEQGISNQEDLEDDDEEEGDGERVDG